MAAQDIKKRLEPGGAQPVNVAGDFIFLKFADRPINVIISDGRSGQTRVTMEIGDKYRPRPFEQFEIENPDLTNPAQVIMTIGQGDYSSQIVKGEIQVEPGLRKADGTLVADTRYDVVLDLIPTRIEQLSYLQNEVIKSRVIESPNRARVTFWGPAGEVSIYDPYGAANNLTFYDRETLFQVGAATLATDSHTVDVAYWPGKGYVLVQNNKLYSVTQSGLTLILTFPLQSGGPGDETTGIDYDPFTDTLIASNGGSTPGDERLYQIDNALTVTKINGGKYGTARFRIDRLTGDFVYCSSVNGISISERATPKTVKLAPPSSGIAWAKGGLFTGLFAWGMVNSGTQGIVRKTALDDVTTKPEFDAIKSGCELTRALLNLPNTVQTTASITLAQTPSGLVVQGELIRAALEWYFKRPIGADYLDHIYSLSMSKNQDGLPFKRRLGGTQTFDRQNIADNFGTLLPGQLIITIDDSLALEGAF
ncbi:MAG: hypothetical protein R3303_05665 [Marinobacter sp.]|nr:hypothetical protein [Marinobacter sp.]